MSAPPRVVVVSRPSDYEELISRHATREQARFFLERRDQRIEEVEARHHAFEAVMLEVSRAIPVRWRRTRVARKELPRFVWEPRDVLVAVGQYGLVANVAKYLDGQPVIGINPDPERWDGVLVKHPVSAFGALLQRTAEGKAQLEARTMVEARLDDGQRLLALNEVYVGQRTHQSSRYQIALRDRSERHSSSGLVVTTGTGATGWARSIARERAAPPELPSPERGALAFFVREAFPSVATGTDLTQGVLEAGEALHVRSEMNEGGVLFGDGLEHDRLEFGWGLRAELRVARERLQLVA